MGPFSKKDQGLYSIQLGAIEKGISNLKIPPNKTFNLYANMSLDIQVGSEIITLSDLQKLMEMT